jgi:hypothetical protein
MQNKAVPSVQKRILSSKNSFLNASEDVLEGETGIYCQLPVA